MFSCVMMSCCIFHFCEQNGIRCETVINFRIDMKLAIAQINCVLGDLDNNSAKILDYAVQARDGGAQLLLTPELSLCGYPPEDLLLRDGFYQACHQALNALASRISGIAVVVGHPHELNGKRYNAASLLKDGRVVATYLKHFLPNYSVFDEERYFDCGVEPLVFEVEGIAFCNQYLRGCMGTRGGTTSPRCGGAGLAGAECLALRRAKTILAIPRRASAYRKQVWLLSMPTWWAVRMSWFLTVVPLPWTVPVS